MVTASSGSRRSREGGSTEARTAWERTQPTDVVRGRLTEQVVAVRVRVRDARRQREARRAEVEGLEDAAAQLAAERLTGDRLDNQPRDHVVRVGVGVAGPGREERLVG